MKRSLILFKKTSFCSKKMQIVTEIPTSIGKVKNPLKISKISKISQRLCCKTFTRVLLTCRKHYTSDNLGKGLSFCISKDDIRCPRISSTENMASEGDFPSRISAANAIAKIPQL